MKLFYTVIFLLSLASAAFAREESVLARVTSYWANEGTSGEYAIRADVCAPAIARSIRNEFRNGAKLFFPMASAPPSTPDRQWLIAKPLVYADERRAKLKAIVVDRFFETKLEAMAWTNAHSEFMILQIVPPGSDRELSEP